MSDHPAPDSPLRLYTIGVYGFDAESFFAALTNAQIDVFCDVRARRGVRGSAYAFANSRRLQARLAELGIRYVHRPDLAPSPELRSRQTDSDKAAHTPKRERTKLSPAFVDGYTQEVLAHADSQAVLDALSPGRRLVFCCVERYPDACHRSLLATELGRNLNLPVEHLLP
ncbi:MAG: DUF488 domain-containing protein [Caldilineaceae bacterium]|nr:DUF488 domain-containing protein [Caldilineaceae bacterium]